MTSITKIPQFLMQLLMGVPPKTALPRYLAASLPTPDDYIALINKKEYIGDGVPIHIFSKSELFKGLDIA